MEWQIILFLLCGRGSQAVRSFIMLSHPHAYANINSIAWGLPRRLWFAPSMLMVLRQMGAVPGVGWSTPALATSSNYTVRGWESWENPQAFVLVEAGWCWSGWGMFCRRWSSAVQPLVHQCICHGSSCSLGTCHCNWFHFLVISHPRPPGEASYTCQLHHWGAPLRSRKRGSSGEVPVTHHLDRLVRKVVFQMWQPSMWWFLEIGYPQELLV